MLKLFNLILLVGVAACDDKVQLGNAPAASNTVSFSCATAGEVENISRSQAGCRSEDVTVPGFGFACIPLHWARAVALLDLQTGEELARLQTPSLPGNTILDLEGNCIAAGDIVRKFDSTCIPEVAPPTVTPECQVFSTDLNIGALGVAVDSQNNIWVTTKEPIDPSLPTSLLVKLDPETGAVLQQLDVGYAYDLKLGPDGMLYSYDSYTTQLKQIDPSLGSVTLVRGFSSELRSLPQGIAIGEDRRIYIADLGCVRIYDPSADVFSGPHCPVVPYTGNVTSIAVDAHHVFAANPSSNLVFVYDRNGNPITELETNGNEPASVAVDARRKLWILNQASANIERFAAGALTPLDTISLNADPGNTITNFTWFQPDASAQQRSVWSLEFEVPQDATLEEVAWSADIPTGTSVELTLYSGLDAASELLAEGPISISPYVPNAPDDHRYFRLEFELHPVMDPESGIVTTPVLAGASVALREANGAIVR